MKLSVLVICVTLLTSVLATTWGHQHRYHGDNDDRHQHRSCHRHHDGKEEDKHRNHHHHHDEKEEDKHRNHHHHHDEKEEDKHRYHHHHGEEDDDDNHHCNLHQRKHHHHRNHHHQTGHSSPVHTITSHGTPYPPSPIQPQPDRDEPESGIPLGHPRGPIIPSSPPVNLVLKGSGSTNGSESPPPIAPPRRLLQTESCGGSGIVFDSSTLLEQGDTETGTNGSPAEPSGAKAGNVIFATSNWRAFISTDGGATFSTIDPTVYAGPANASTDGGFCCDQVVQYLPSIDRFVWLIQYNVNNNNVNKLRLITFHPSDVSSNGLTSWIYLDILSSGGWLDYGELGVGDTQLYLSNTLYGSTSGLIVFRIPIAALNVVGTLTYRQTHPSDGTVAQGSRLSQNPGDTVFWAGHSQLGTQIRVFKWAESSTSYFWNELAIDAWPTNTANFFSACPGGNGKTNWLFVNSANNIIGATRRSANEVWFAWNANSGGGFTNPHVQIVQVNVGNWPSLSAIKQWQIWNPNFAFAFPNFYTSNCNGDVGLAIVFGGNTSNPSSAVGVITSEGVLTQTVYYPELSDTCEFRFGDYLSVRSENGVSYQGFVYANQNTISGVARNPRYVEFGRG